MVFVDAQSVAHCVELVDEQVRRPEVGGAVGQMCAVAAPDLVVMDDRPPGLVRQNGDVPHVVVRHSWAAMQDKQGKCAGPRIIRLGDLHPGFVATKRHQPGRTSHGDQNEPVKVSCQDH